MTRTGFKLFLPLILFCALFAICTAILKAVDERVAYAQAGTPSQITLAAGLKLEGAGWHCWSGGSCELWYLTRPRRAGETPETHAFTNADGSRKYVIKEQ
jgi:hypothetical protein